MEAVGVTEGAEEDGDFLMIKLFYCFVCFYEVFAQVLAGMCNLKT